MKNQIADSRRLYYIDNLRIFLTLLVVAHHWALANGGPGDWYTVESNLGAFGSLILSQFVAVNQAFFMGFFFLISGYLVPGSYDRKGGRKFLKERAIRLGIPLMFYYFIISPLIHFSVDRFSGDYAGNFLQYLSTQKGIFSSGPLWFVMMLLVFGLGYHLIRLTFHKRLPAIPERSSRLKWMTLIVGFVVGFTYVIRIYNPVGDWLQVPLLGFQPAHVTQYIVCFSLGIAAYRWNILDKISLRTAKKSFISAQILILVVFPAIFLLSGKSDDIALFMGGGSVYSFLFALWEQLVALTMIIGLTGIFKRYFNSQSTLLKNLSRSSYAIYVFHGVVLVGMFLLFQSFEVNSLHKFVILLLPNLVFCYLLAKLILKIPPVKKVL